MKRIISTILTCALLLALAACGNGAQSTAPQSSNANTSHEVQAPTEDAPENSGEQSSDNRGIPGMSSYVLRAVLEMDPFGVPMTPDVPAPAEASNYCAKTCTSLGPNRGNVQYDYSISMDSDDEIIGASLGVTSITANETELLNAADLFFFAVSLVPYDSCDKDTLTAWFEENVRTANTTGTSITIGDAVFTLYGNPGLLYVVDISKNT